MQDTIVFFDGVCNLCNGTVRLLIKLDRKKQLKFSSLQGQTAKEKLNKETIQNLDSIVLYKDGIQLNKAKAVIAILCILGGPAKLISYVLKIFPLIVLDTSYNCIAKSRYKLFGKTDNCALPTESESELFLD